MRILESRTMRAATTVCTGLFHLTEREIARLAMKPVERNFDTAGQR
jgi:hypothetical protein